MISKIKIPARIDRFLEVVEFLTGYARELGFSPEKIGEIKLIIEEILVNIISYAYPEKKGDVEVNCHPENGNRLVINIVDSGVPFDPLSLSPPDVSLSIDEREIGGLGVFLVRELAEAVTYTREGNHNILTLTIAN